MYLLVRIEGSQYKGDTGPRFLVGVTDPKKNVGKGPHRITSDVLSPESRCPAVSLRGARSGP